MHDEFTRALRRLESVRDVVAVGKISGAVGTSAHLSPRVEAHCLQKLRHCVPPPSPRRSCNATSTRNSNSRWALVGASIERWAVEFRHLQRTEVLEAEEPFTKGQKGSSAMPHKRNPITWERLTGLARVLRGNAMASLENVALWHERDISHSSVERIIFPDSCTLLDYMFGLLTRLMDGIVVYPANMKKNLGLARHVEQPDDTARAHQEGSHSRSRLQDLSDAAMKTWEVKHAGRDDADFVEQSAGCPSAKAVQERRTRSPLLAGFPFLGSENRFKKLGPAMPEDRTKKAKTTGKGAAGNLSPASLRPIPKVSSCPHGGYEQPRSFSPTENPDHLRRHRPLLRPFHRQALAHARPNGAAERSGNKTLPKAARFPARPRKARSSSPTSPAPARKNSSGLPRLFRQRGLRKEPNDREALYVRKLGARNDESYEFYRSYIETRPAETVANILICLDPSPTTCWINNSGNSNKNSPNRRPARTHDLRPPAARAAENLAKHQRPPSP